MCRGSIPEMTVRSRPPAPQYLPLSSGLRQDAKKFANRLAPLWRVCALP